MNRLAERVRHVRAADGARLAITELGAGVGPAVVLVHGFAQNRFSFTLGELPDGFVTAGARVFVAELRGHGRSERPAAPWDLHAHLDVDLPAILTAVADWTGGPVHYQGHSLGGMLGYALLTKALPVRSLTTYCAPLVLGATRHAVRAAALLAPMAARGKRVPMQHFLRAVSGPLTKPGARFALRAAQRFTSLVNPDLGVPERLRETLARADPESPAVIRALAKMAVHRRPELCGIDLATAVAEASIPICVVVGTRDVFAPPASVAPILGRRQAGPRKLIQIPEGGHVDVPLGHHARHLAEDVWRFIESS